MRIRKLRILTVLFIVLVLLVAYGLALLRTYVFKPPPSAAGNPVAVSSLEESQYSKDLRTNHVICIPH